MTLTHAESVLFMRQEHYNHDESPDKGAAANRRYALEFMSHQFYNFLRSARQAPPAPVAELWTLADFGRAMKNIGLLLLLMILVGCCSPSKKSVQRSFLQDHPGYTVAGITKVVDRGDIPYADFTITYKKPSDRDAHEDVWHYYDLRDTSHVIKETVK